MNFEWDKEKDKLNIKKHNITFAEASTVFSDPLSWTFPDPDHSLNEHRYIIIGYSHFNKLLVISHTERNKNIRIISTRKATKHERKYYEK
ncbi:hypothetical protein BVX93_01610 [bacterium B13(2017)]|nr:hypothetical protein BVX93_01610 [bacterium B13(2017)]